MKPTFFSGQRSLSLMGGIALCGALLASGVTREAPTGSIEGRVTLQENGLPLAKASLTFIPKFSAPDQAMKVRVIECDKDGRFSLRNVAAGDYDISVSARAHETPMKRYTVVEGKPQTLDLALTPVSPYLDIYAEQKVFTPAEQPAVKVEGFHKAKDLKLTLYHVDLDHVLKSGGLYGALSPLSNTSYQKGKDPIKVGKKVSSSAHDIKNKDAEGVFVEYVKLPKLEPGVYWLNCNGGGILRGTPLIVTDIALITKRADGDVRYFVADIVTGKPVAGAKVGYSDGLKRTEAGVSGADGTIAATLPNSSRGKKVALFATKGYSLAVVDFERQNEGRAHDLAFSIYTDRPIYRPGDSFQFKAIVRKMSGTKFLLPTPGAATVEFRDPEDGLLERKSLAVSEHGTVNGSFDFNKESAPGDYSVKVIVGGQDLSQRVTCAAYRKPLYSISVTPEKSSYVRGQKARFKVKAEYYYGGPVAGAKVQASVFRETYWDSSIYGEEFEGLDQNWYGGSGGDYLDDIEATTDANGIAWIEVETLRKKDPKELESDYLYTLSAGVTDESEQYFSGEGTVPVFRGEFAAGISVSAYAAKPDQPVEVSVQLKNRSNQQPISGKQVVIKTAYEFWTSNGTRELPWQTVTGSTDADGAVKLTVAGDRVGSLRIRAHIVDDAGNETVESTWIWIDGQTTSESRPLVDLAVKLDKSLYKAGDVANAIILCDQPGGSALVTIEGAKVYEQRVISLDSPSASLSFKVEDEYAPNVSVVVCTVRDKRFNSSSTEMKVDLGARKLQVEVTSDQSEYLPGGKARYHISTKRADGTPTAAEVSLGVVDESIYALSPDSTDPLRSFYPRRYNSVETLNSFPELYLDGGDKAPSSIQVRRIFKDTAYWNPTIQTDIQGQATVEVVLPDNLTTWRATAVAATDLTEVGMSVSRALARKPLMVRLEAPSTLVAGDSKVRLSGFITNGTGESKEVQVLLEVQGASVEGDLGRKLTVPSGQTESIEWLMDAKESGTAVFVAKAWTASGESDGVERRISIQPNGQPDIVSTAGELTAQKQFKVVVDENSDRKFGRLRLTISPSLASVLVQSLEDLIDYPYGCVEQTMSRFMPAVVVKKTLADLGLPPTARDSEIRGIVADGYTRLKRMQHGSGMWGWWEYDEDNPGMTAYVLEGMFEAGRAGYPGDKFRIGRALDGSLKFLQTPWIEPTRSEYWSKDADWHAYVKRLKKQEVIDRAQLCYAVALHGKAKEAMKALEGMPLGDGGASAYACALLTAKVAGSSKAPSYAKQVLALVVKAGSLAHWDDAEFGVESTSRCFQALWKAGVGKDLAPSVLRYLMLQRRAAGWTSTRDTAVSVLALSGYLAQSNEMVGDGRLDILVNGNAFGSIPINRKALVNPSLVVDIPIADLKVGENQISLAKTDSSLAYFSAEMRQYVPMKPVSREGVVISKTYHLLRSQPLEDGTLRFLPNPQPELSFQRGDLIQVQVHLQVDKEQQFVLIEDPVPSGFRVTEREDPGLYEEWTWWFSRLLVYDAKVAVFATSLTPGSHVIQYTIRAENPGDSTALATSAYPMYDPDHQFFGSSVRVTIR